MDFRLLKSKYTEDSQFEFKIVDQDLFAFSYVDLAFSFGEVDFSVTNLDIRSNVKGQIEKIFFKDSFGRLHIVLHFPVPGVDIPDRARSLRFHQLIINNTYSRVFSDLNQFKLI